MYGTTFALLNLLLRIITAQKPTPIAKPTVTVVTNSSSFLCSEQFLVVGEDFVTLELDLSGNNSDYSLGVFDGPRFRIHQLVTKNGKTTEQDDPVCEPFNNRLGFCVKRHIRNTTGCSCEVVGPQVYRVKAVYRIQDINETRIRLLWPSVTGGNINKNYYLPEARAEPNITKFQITPSFQCALDYQVEGEDYTILELDVSGNSSRYSFEKDVWPHFEYKTRRNGKLSKALLHYFPNACSCEQVGKDTFRLRANFTIGIKDMSHGQISLTWPGRKGPVRYDYNLPEVKLKPTEPEIKVYQIAPSFNCIRGYQVVNEDYTQLELDVSGNSSRYSFKKDLWPRFEYKTRTNGRLSKAMLFCNPFTTPQNGFCVTKDSFPNGCSCKNIGNATFRLKANFTIKMKEMSHGQISLTWPGKHRPERYGYDLPEVKMKETQPKIYLFRKSSYFTCTENYQVLGVDYTLLELDVSKSNSVYSYEKDRGPRFEYKTRSNGKLSEAMTFCTPFTDRQKGFCVTKQSFPNGCSCEQVGVDRYRLKANFTVTALEMSHGMLSLTWPGKRGALRYDYDLPEVKTRPSKLLL
ncbi:hypothetical protein PoB_003534400 [Plakobranchus ocellatus]|uniref:Uncharacterized protein n=1 Tax=Plakobranchus ocellatus TaxID=259542 RepID=A0AAV4AM58_9GAST|nr:hypothetical protein PoB_003534400 [Plakobranchus ocellatus]